MQTHRECALRMGPHLTAADGGSQQAPWRSSSCQPIEQPWYLAARTAKAPELEKSIAIRAGSCSEAPNQAAVQMMG